jgi:hypothetical protein
MRSGHFVKGTTVGVQNGAPCTVEPLPEAVFDSTGIHLRNMPDHDLRRFCHRPADAGRSSLLLRGPILDDYFGRAPRLKFY